MGNANRAKKHEEDEVSRRRPEAGRPPESEEQVTGQDVQPGLGDEILKQLCETHRFYMRIIVLGTLGFFGIVGYCLKEFFRLCGTDVTFPIVKMDLAMLPGFVMLLCAVVVWAGLSWLRRLKDLVQTSEKVFGRTGLGDFKVVFRFIFLIIMLCIIVGGCTFILFQRIALNELPKFVSEIGSQTPIQKKLMNLTLQTISIFPLMPMAEFAAFIVFYFILFVRPDVYNERPVFVERKAIGWSLVTAIILTLSYLMSPPPRNIKWQTWVIVAIVVSALHLGLFLAWRRYRYKKKLKLYYEEHPEDRPPNTGNEAKKR